MKRTYLASVLLLLTVAILLSACSGGAPTLEFENGAFRDPNKVLAFHCAPICYRAASANSKANAVAIVKTSLAETPLYSIEGLDSALWLSAEDHTLYHAEGTELPTLSQLKPTQISNTLADFGVSVITDTQAIADLVETYEKGTTVPRQKIIPMHEARYEMVFSSETYAGILYVLECWRFSEDVLVYARLDGSGRIPADLYPGIHAEIVNGEAVFNLGKTLVYDRYADVCYSVGSAYDAYFPMN